MGHDRAVAARPLSLPTCRAPPFAVGRDVRLGQLEAAEHRARATGVRRRVKPRGAAQDVDELEHLQGEVTRLEAAVLEARERALVFHSTQSYFVLFRCEWRGDMDTWVCQRCVSRLVTGLAAVPARPGHGWPAIAHASAQLPFRPCRTHRTQKAAGKAVRLARASLLGGGGSQLCHTHPGRLSVWRPPCLHHSLSTALRACLSVKQSPPSHPCPCTGSPLPTDRPQRSRRHPTSTPSSSSCSRWGARAQAPQPPQLALHQFLPVSGSLLGQHASQAFRLMHLASLRAIPPPLAPPASPPSHPRSHPTLPLHQVHPAPGPEEVNWQALWYSHRQRMFRGFLVTPLICLVIMLPGERRSAASAHFLPLACAALR